MKGWGGSGARPNVPNPSPCSLTPPQIIFEGVRGSGYLGDIAIDDVTLKKGECPRRQMDPNKGMSLAVGWRKGGGRGRDREGPGMEGLGCLEEENCVSDCE